MHIHLAIFSIFSVAMMQILVCMHQISRIYWCWPNVSNLEQVFEWLSYMMVFHLQRHPCKLWVFSNFLEVHVFFILISGWRKQEVFLTNQGQLREYDWTTVFPPKWLWLYCLEGSVVQQFELPIFFVFEVLNYLLIINDAFVTKESWIFIGKQGGTIHIALRFSSGNH